MEKEFTEWFDENETKFTHGQFDEKQIAYSAWLEGKKQTLPIQKELLLTFSELITSKRPKGFGISENDVNDFLGI